MAHMFFPVSQQDAAGTSPALPAAFVLAGNPAAPKTALLLSYAYSGALRGRRSLIICRAGPTSDIPLPVPAPANEAALQLICFKYVAGAHDVRKLLSELHDVESAPDIIIVADDLSSLLGGGNGVVGTSVASAGRWGGGLGPASPESELALTLAQLIEALSFCDRAGSARGGQICRSELLIAEDLSREAPAPKMFFVYEKFIPSFFSVHPAEASDGCSTTGVGGGRNVEREGFELSQLNHRACASCSERWMARFSAGEGSVDTVRFCC